jgi:ketosteroid isomerase-like protein
MNTASLHSPIVRHTIEAINQGKLDDFMALFAPDATVVDVSTYTGHKAIRHWAQRETFNVQVRFQVEREKNAEGTVVEGHVQSVGGYNGPATFSFTLHGNMIERLVIE